MSATSIASGKGLEPKDRFAIVQTKCNLGKKGPSLEYSIDDTGLTIDGISEITDDALLNSTMKTVNQDIDEWLEDLLSSGPMAANEVKAAAEAKGYGRSKLGGAVKRLGIRRKPTGVGGSWTWELPQQDAKVAEQGWSSSQDMPCLEVRNEWFKSIEFESGARAGANSGEPAGPRCWPLCPGAQAQAGTA